MTKESHLELETGGGYGLEVSGEQPVGKAAGGFYRFTSGPHPVPHGWTEGALEVLLAQRDEAQADVLQEVFVSSGIPSF